jgi:hypothetical protein
MIELLRYKSGGYSIVDNGDRITGDGLCVYIWCKDKETLFENIPLLNELIWRPCPRNRMTGESFMKYKDIDEMTSKLREEYPEYFI